MRKINVVWLVLALALGFCFVACDDEDGDGSDDQTDAGDGATDEGESTDDGSTDDGSTDDGSTDGATAQVGDDCLTLSIAVISMSFGTCQESEDACTAGTEAVFTENADALISSLAGDAMSGVMSGMDLSSIVQSDCGDLVCCINETACDDINDSIGSLISSFSSILPTADAGADVDTDMIDLSCSPTACEVAPSMPAMGCSDGQYCCPPADILDMMDAGV